MNRLILVVYLLLIEAGLRGQGRLDNKAAFEFSYANDVTGMTDKYYTNGVAFALSLPIFIHSPFNPGWLRRSRHDASYHSISLNYDVFTPDLNKPWYLDRPFASTLLIGSKHQYVFGRRSLRVTSQLQLGIIGQATGAGKLQNALHNIMPGAGPVAGWEYQIRNDLAVNYSFMIEKLYRMPDLLAIIASSNTCLGVPFTQSTAGVKFRFGFYEGYFDYYNVEVNRKWQLYLFGGLRGSFVAYNATLQGGLFNIYNPYELQNINHWLATADIGCGLVYNKFKLSYSQTLVSPEFSGATAHSWGEIRFLMWF